MFMKPSQSHNCLTIRWLRLFFKCRHREKSKQRRLQPSTAARNRKPDQVPKLQSWLWKPIARLRSLRY